MRAAQRVARESAVSRTRAQRNVAVALAGDLGVDDFENWPPAERMGFTQLAPIFGCASCDARGAPEFGRVARDRGPRYSVNQSVGMQKRLFRQGSGGQVDESEVGVSEGELTAIERVLVEAFPADQA